VDVNEIILSGLLELYTAGLTSEEENVQVLLYMKQYPEVVAAIHEIEDSIETYAHSKSIIPGNSVKDKIFSAINKNEKTHPIYANPLAETKMVSIRPYWKWVAAASVILLLSSSLLNLLFYNQYHSLNKNLQQTQQELADSKQGLNDLKQDLSVIQSKYSEPVKLNGVNATPDAVAKIFWLKNTGEVYVDPSNLPEVPKGKQFQLWAIVDGKPVDAGLIITSKIGNKYRIQKMKSFGKAQAFAITIEKEGGSTTPTMDKMVVMGKL
jgi:hypothetical protein